MSLFAKPRRWAGIGLLLSLLLLLAACGADASSAGTPEPTATTAAPTATSAPTGPNVTINGFSFQPASLTVHVGDTVTWTNKASVDHTATSDAGAFDGAVPSGQTFTFTFTKAGTFPYHCSIHPTMTATIIVTA